MDLRQAALFKGIAAITLVCLVAITIYIKWVQCYWTRRKVSVPQTTFLFGNSKNILLQIESFGENLRDVYQLMKSKGVKHCGYYMLINPIWVVLDINLIKDILTKDFHYFCDRCIYVNEKNDPLTGQLFMLKGMEKWKNVRTKLTPTFTSGKIKAMFPIVTACAEELVKSLSEKQIVDIKDVMGRYTTDVIGSCAFGIDCNSLKNPDSEFRRYARMTIEIDSMQAIKQFLAFTFPWIMDALRLPLFSQKVIDFFSKSVRGTVEYREQHNIISKDFMHLLMQLMNKDGVKLTFDELTAQAFGFFIAGYETSSTTLGFCFYELVQNPEIQELLRQEVISVYEKYDGQLSYESLMEMNYLENCISETLRKYPPVPIILRECTETYKVPDSDLTIEKGTRVFIPILGIQHDPEYYPEPEVFNPDRFTNENKLGRLPFTWLPFGEGPRNCIGLRFGMMQVKVALATLIKNYKFSINKKTKIPLVINPRNFLMSSEGGIWLNVEKVQ